MSISDEKTTKFSAGNDEKAAEASISKKNSNKEVGGFVIMFFIIGFFVSLYIGWLIFPKLLYSQKKQPLDFNHVTHVEAVDDGCESCHFFREDGSYAGVTKLEQCVDCHEEAQGESPDEIKFVEEYVTKGKEVPWFVYSRQPDCVFFSHAAHVKAAELDCTVCHGHIGESEHLKMYEENIITGYSRDIWGKNIIGLKKNSWDRMKMDDCAQCHAEETGRKDACFVCHK